MHVPRQRGIAGKCPTTGKVQHDTEEEARLHKKALRKKWGAKTKPYICPFCGFYHVGHSRKRR
jgi:hypothetical protein